MAGAQSNVLIDHLSDTRSATRDLLWMVGFSLLTAGLAQIRLTTPFTPVPFTGQTFAVLLSGAVLGSRRAFLSQVLYLAEGAAGLPVFAGGAASVAHLLGPTGGYLWCFPCAAGLVGWLVEVGASRARWKLAAALVLADFLILVVGTLWLHNSLRTPYRQASLWGFYPFLFGEVLKIALVGLSIPRVLSWLQARR